MHLNSTNLIPWRVTEILGVRKQGAVSALAHWAAQVGKAPAPLSGCQKKKQQAEEAAPEAEVAASALPCYSSCRSLGCRGMGREKMTALGVPGAARAVPHMLCPGRTQGCVWDLCIHTAWRGSLAINLKWKHLIVSCINNSLVLPHQQWQWAAVKPNHRQNRALAEQTSACGRQQSCPHLFPSTAVWARLSLCVPFSQMGLSLSTADRCYHCSDHKLFPLHTPETLWTVSILVPEKQSKKNNTMTINHWVNHLNFPRIASFSQENNCSTEETFLVSQLDAESKLYKYDKFCIIYIQHMS